MVKTCAVFVLTMLAGIAVCQSDVHKYPSAIKAPGEARPELCRPQLLRASLPTWAPGSLSADIVVASNGKIVELTILKSSYDSEETKVATEELRQWEFEPAYYHGYYVNVHFTIEVIVAKDSIRVHIPSFAEDRCKFAPICHLLGTFRDCWPKYPDFTKLRASARGGLSVIA